MSCYADADEPDEDLKLHAKSLAFLARYGRIPPSESARYPRRYLGLMLEAVAELLEEEKPSGLGRED